MFYPDLCNFRKKTRLLIECETNAPVSSERVTTDLGVAGEPWVTGSGAPAARLTGLRSLAPAPACARPGPGQSVSGAGPGPGTRGVRNLRSELATDSVLPPGSGVNMLQRI